MWKVLVADDEPKIRRGLRSALSRLPGIEVAGEAEDGEEALEKAMALSPDILLIDVRMPRLGGLELIERLNALGRDWVVIVVTGHDEIEYAQRAVRLRVFDYLLKPVAAAALEAAVAKAKTELALRRASDQYTAWARRELERSMPALRERFLRAWVAGGMSSSEIEESARFLGLALAPGSSMLLLRFSERVAPVSGMGEEYRRLLALSARSILEAALAGREGAMVFEDETDGLVAIAPMGGEEEAESLAASIGSRIESTLHATPHIARQAVKDSAALPELYGELSERLNEKGNYQAFVLMAQAYIEKHYREPSLSLERVAAELELSSGYLSRLMKMETGLGFVDWLQRFRIHKAAQLMRDPALKVFEAAEMVGYRDQHYFSRAFKRVMGVSPVEYRRGAK
jgi:two-component system response regulator YesN